MAYASEARSIYNGVEESFLISVPIAVIAALDLIILHYHCDFTTMANKGGRPQALIWEKFLKVTRNGKTLARCSVCEHELVNRPERMTKHSEKCKTFKFAKNKES